jgi:hypothetical protein
VWERIVENPPKVGGALFVEIESVDKVLQLTQTLRFATAASETDCIRYRELSVKFRSRFRSKLGASALRIQ